MAFGNAEFIIIIIVIFIIFCFHCTSHSRGNREVFSISRLYQLRQSERLSDSLFYLSGNSIYRSLTIDGSNAAFFLARDFEFAFTGSGVAIIVFGSFRIFNSLIYILPRETLTDFIEHLKTDIWFELL